MNHNFYINIIQAFDYGNRLKFYGFMYKNRNLINSLNIHKFKKGFIIIMIYMLINNENSFSLLKNSIFMNHKIIMNFDKRKEFYEIHINLSSFSF